MTTTPLSSPLLFVKSARLLALAAIALSLLQSLPAAAQLKSYDSKYYTIQSDLDPETVREAILHMNYMAEEYHERTRGIATGQINRKFQFMLFSRREDYRAVGGPDGSVGAFLGANPGHPLAALRVTNFSPDTLWHTIQHEGFHQFCTEVISGGDQNLPIWLEEGLAEYFGHAVFTGESLVPGIIPPDRLAMVQHMIPTGRFRPLTKLMSMSRSGWLQVSDGVDYLHVWSIVQFLVHSENGRYMPAFEQYIRAASRPGAQGVTMQTFLGPADEIEKKWRAWWLALEPDVSKDLYARAAVTGLCACLGRAATQKQDFDGAVPLLMAMDAKQLKFSDEDWLPASLADSIRYWMSVNGAESKFEFGPDKRKPQVSVTLSDGTRLTATYNPLAKTHRVTIEADALPAELARAAALLADAKQTDARKLLQDAIKKYPQSPQLPAAKKLLQQTFAVASAQNTKPVTPPVQVASATPKPPPAVTPVEPKPNPPVEITPTPIVKRKPPTMPELPPILVISARYGVSDHWVDVTDQCRDMVKDDTLDFPRELHVGFGVDPYPFHMKYLDLIIMLNGVPVRMFIASNHDGSPMRISAKHSSPAH